MRLERINPDRNEFRFYELDVQPTLFCEYALLIRWGRIGKPSRQRIARTGPLDEVQAAVEKIRKAKSRSGYTKPDGNFENPHQKS